MLSSKLKVRSTKKYTWVHYFCYHFIFEIRIYIVSIYLIQIYITKSKSLIGSAIAGISDQNEGAHRHVF